MSHIAFRLRKSATRVGGGERRHIRWVLDALAHGFLDRALAPAGAATSILLTPRDGKIHEALLNTVLAFGGPPLWFAAQIHLSCEAHGHILPEDRAYFADLLEAEIGGALFQEETQGYGRGWRDVVELLRSRKKGAVVLEFSGTDGFHVGARSWDKAVAALPENARITRGRPSYGDGAVLLGMSRQAIWDLCPPDWQRTHDALAPTAQNADDIL